MRNNFIEEEKLQEEELGEIEIVCSALVLFCLFLSSFMTRHQACFILTESRLL